MNTNSKLILDIINNTDRHLTAEQIYLELKKNHSKIVLATVYNNLKSLYEQDLIGKVSIEGYPDRYDKIIRHDHLVCKRCGKLSDITLDDLTENLKQQTGVDMISYDLKINYICPECHKTAVNDD